MSDWAELSDWAEVLADTALGGGRRLIRCGQISLASNSKANGLNEAIPSQVVHIVVLNKLILLKDVKKLIVLPSKAIIGCSIMVGHME